MNTYEFIKKTNKLLEEWSGNQDPEVLDMWFGFACQVKCDSKTLRKALKELKTAVVNGWDSDEAVKGMQAFGEVTDSYKDRFKVELEHAKMRSMLESVLPFEAARYEARKIDPDSDISMSKHIKDLVQGDGNILNEYRDMDILIRKLLKVVKTLRAGEQVRNKDLRIINELKESIGYVAERRFK
jgi:hypothetical protein